MPTDLTWSDIVERGLGAEDIYGEIAQIVADLRMENRLKGGDDRAFGAVICAQLGQLAPVLPPVAGGVL